MRAGDLRLESGFIRRRSVDGIELFTNTHESLSIDEFRHRIRIEFTSRPAPAFGETLRLLKNVVRY